MKKIIFFFLAIASTWIVNAADVQISQLIDTPDPATRGGNINYAIALLNGNNDTANDVTLTIPLAASTTFVSVDDGNCAHDGGNPGTLNCNFGNITGDGLGAPITNVNLVIATSGATGNTIALTATVGTSSVDNNAANDSLTQNTTIDDGADLNIALADTVDPVIAGGVYSYNVDVNNIGPNDSNTITVKNTLPSNVSYVAAAGTGWTCGIASQIVTCTRPTITNGASAPTITIDVKVTGATTGTVTNLATVSSVTGDPTGANNTATENTLINQGTDLAITKAVATPVVGGATTSFTLSPRNLGPYAADTVSISDVLPAGFTFISAVGAGWTCGEAAGTVTCSRATYAIGATDDIVIQTNVPASGNNIVNNAVISSATSDAINSNNTGSVTFSVVPDGANLAISKTKTPNPVAAGENMTSRIRVSNAGPNATTGVITVTETLSVNETYQSDSGSNWTCNHIAPVVTCEYGLVLPNGGSSSFLEIITQAGVISGSLSNTACVSDVGGQADAVAGNDCATAIAVSTTDIANLAILKTVATAGGVNNVLEVGENTITYVLSVTNTGDDIVDAGGDDGVIIEDTIPGFVSGGAPHGTVINASVTGGTQQNFTCNTVNANVTCTLNNGETFGGSNDGGVDDTVEITITATRGLFDGAFTNTATVTSEILGDNNPANNTASVGITINPVADVEMQSLVISPSPTKAGTEVTYVLTFINNGPSSAANVAIDHLFGPPATRSYQLLSTNPSQGSCAALAGNTLNCSVGTLTRNQTETITFVVRPGWDGANTSWTLANTSTISTTSTESNAGNNSQASGLDVQPAELDLLVNNVDLKDPVGWTPTPGAFPASDDNIIVYKVDITNRGPSLATDILLTDVLTPKTAKQVTFLCDDAGTTGCVVGTSICNNLGSSATGPATITSVCNIPDMNPNTTTTRYLYFRAVSAPDSIGDTHTNVTTIASNEDDTIASNNSAFQTTSVRVMVDLAVTKSPSKASVSLNEPFNWDIVVSNSGPGDSAQSNLSDSLPAGMELTGPPVPSQGTCTGVALGTSFTCSLGTINNGANSTVTVPVRVTVVPAGGTTTNSASATSFGVDTDGTNDTNTPPSVVSVTKSSISGKVYNDQNDNGAVDASENGISGVTLTLTGNDTWGNAINLVQVTDASGDYTFDNLPPGSNYTVTETHPVIYSDGLDSKNGVVITNSRNTDVLTAINLAVNTALVQYNFAEIGLANLQGSVWHDLNNDGIKGVGETTGIFNVTITLTGTETVGGNAVNFVTTTDASGDYQFNKLKAGTYVLTETQPVTWGDGTEQLGSAGGVVANDVFTGIVLTANQSGINYNFGEQGASLSGKVYRDSNSNGIVDGGEVDISGVQIALSGIDLNGISINRVVTTDVSGNYQFIGLPASNGTGYTITETQPALIFDGLDAIGSLGGTLGNDVLSSIIVPANAIGINYNFGEGDDIVSSIAGNVFIDRNNDGIQTADELGIENVSLSLTGVNSKGATVNKTVLSGINGKYIFSNLIASDNNGYTITQIQPPTYLDGLDSKLGVVIAGSNQTDIIENIILVDDENLTENNFAELFTGFISGSVFVDRNDNGIKEPNDSDLPNVTLTLMGMNALNEVVNITVQTDADGDYIFSNLMDSNANGYTVTQTQPQDYNDGLDSKLGIVIASSKTTDLIQGLNILNGSSAENNDFAELYKGSLSGTVFIDNNNGLLESNEIGITGVVLNLTGTDLFNNPVTLTATTNAFGQYQFTQLPPSDASGYTLTEIHPQLYTDGQESIGNQVLPNTNVSDVFTDIAITLNSELTEYNFAELLTGSISGYVYIDKNNDGIKTAGEPGIENVTLTLTGVDYNGQLVERTLTTDEQGFYHFTLLLPSNELGYKITETHPEIYLDGLESIANLPFQGSHQSDVIESIVLLASEDLEHYNFGELEVASISGTVWVDENDNGIIDEIEKLRIMGTTITLTGIESQQADENSPVTITQTVKTDEQGFYIFENLRTGDYQVAQEQPIAWLDGKDELGNLGGDKSNDLFESIALNTGQHGVNYNFGELGSSIQGTVYSDLNDNGTQEANEAGIPDVEIQLRGIDINGQIVTRTVYTVIDGQYIFEHLPLPNAQGYTVTEIQPELVDDGKDNLGSHGGVLANDIMSEIVFASHLTQAVEYNFGEILQNPAKISGTVWLDSNHNRLEDDGVGLSGWTVELIESRDDPKDNTNITVIATLITDSEGNYLFDGLSPGTYEVRFIHPQGGVIYGYPVSDEPEADLTAGTIRGLMLEAGEHIDEQNLPIDPSGVVYDSKTRETVAGATVTISGPAGFDPDQDLIGGQGNVTQITGVNGLYQYLLFSSAPAGTYYLTVVEPTGYLPGVSKRILACTNTPDILTSPNPALVQLQDTAPPLTSTLHDETNCSSNSSGFSAGENSTQYYLSFNITPLLPSANVVNNHIPVDPIDNELLSVIKTSTVKNATRGDLVPYNITVTNNANVPLNNMTVIDQLPPGFKYVQGSARIEGIAIEPNINGRNLTWSNISFAALEQQVFSLIAVIGAGVGEGEYANQAWVEDLINDKIVANIGSATIRIVPDPIFDCSDIIGKVFDDKNTNGYQDEGEKGLPAIRLATAQGLLVTTDSNGRYHIACAQVPNEIRGSNFIIKVDDRTLPSGFRITSENPRVVRLTRGKLVKADFGATIHRVIRIQLNAAAFNDAELKDEFQQSLKQAVEKLRIAPSVLRLAYEKSQESEALIDNRLEVLKDKIEALWEACDCQYELMIEQEVTSKNNGLMELGQVVGGDHE